MEEREELAKRILDSVTNEMDFQEDNLGNKIWWAFCFGSALEFIADKTFKLDYDIDIGVLYGQCNEDKLTYALEGAGYKAKKTIVNDITGKALNMHFDPVEDYIKDTPTIDVYFWYEHSGILYHTYDIKKQGKQIPSEYVLKGVPKDYLIPDPEEIEKEKGIGNPERKQMITDEGTWKMPVFGGAGSSLTMRIPFRIGSLLDIWYSPSWAFREYYKGQSMTPYIKKIKSFKELS